MFLHSLRRSVVAALGGLFVIGAAAAADESPPRPWDGAAFAARPAAMLEAAGRLPALDGEISEDVLLQEVSLTFDAGGRMSRRSRSVFRLLDQGAVDEHPGVGQSWSPWFQERPLVRARVITQDGLEHWLDPATFAESGVNPDSSSLYDDDRQLRAPLPALAPGALVEVEITRVEREPFFAAGTVHGEPLFSDHYRRFRLEIDSPADFPLRFALDLLPGARPRETSTPTGKRWQLELLDFEPEYLLEDGRPLEEPAYPAISVATGKSWGEIAKAYAEIVDRAVAGINLTSELAEATRGAKSEIEKIERLTAWVHRKVRYTGIEFGEAKIVPFPPPVVLRRRYGDCKDKATLLVALLRQAEIPAYLALLQTSPYVETEPDLPGLGAFNHAIVFIPGAQGLWIDATLDTARVGQIPSQEQGRWALVAAGNTAGLVKIPELPAASNRVTLSRVLEMSPYGKGKASETVRYHGVPEIESRSWLSTAKEADRKSWVEGLAEGAFLSKKIQELAFRGLGDLSQPLERVVKVDDVGRVVTTLDGGVVAIPYQPLWVSLPDLFVTPESEEEDDEAETKARTMDFALERPVDTELVVRIVPAAGLRPRELPPSRRLELGAFRFEESFTLGADGGVEVRARFDTGPERRLGPAELDATREALLAFLDETVMALLYFDHEALAEVDHGDSLAGLKRLAAEAAAKGAGAIEGSRLATGYLRVGLVETAREAAEKAVALDPASAPAAETLGLARLHGLDGDVQHEGWNRDQALAAYREAVRLDPSSELAWRNLGVILEHGSDQVKYGQGSDLPAAAEAFRKLREASEEEKELLVNEALAHFWTSQWAELGPLLELLPEDGFSRALRLHIALGTAGFAGLDAELKKRTQPAERGQVLVSLIGDLFLQRRYDEARQLLERPEVARVQGDSKKMLDVQRAILGRIRRLDASLPVLEGPEHIVTRIFLLVLDPQTRQSAFEGLIARGTLAVLSTDETDFRTSFHRALARGAGGVLAQQGPELLALVGDFFSSVVEPKLEGSETQGTLVRYRLPESLRMGVKEAAEDALTCLVVREDGRFKLAALPADSVMTAEYLVELWGRGEHGAIEHWLKLLAKDWPKAEAYADPWERDPFAVLGPQAGVSELETRLALASFVIPRLTAGASGPPHWQEFRDQTAALLESQRAGSSGQRLDTLERLLILVLRHRERFDEAARVFVAMSARHPDSERTRAGQLATLLRGSRPDEAQAWLEAQKASRPDDRETLRWQCRLTERVGTKAQTLDCLRQLTSMPEAASTDWNNYGWGLLVHGGEVKEAIGAAERAVAMKGGYPALHTLAYAHALAGRPREAFDTLKAALESIERTEPLAPDALVLGAIAESLGLPADARRWYQRAVDGDPSTETLVSSSGALARRALDGLKGPAKKGGRKG